MTGTQRWALTAALFAGALVFVLIAIFTHSAVPLFFMWIPLLAVPVVLGRPDPDLRQPTGEVSDGKPDAAEPGTTEPNRV